MLMLVENTHAKLCLTRSGSCSDLILYSLEKPIKRAPHSVTLGSLHLGFAKLENLLKLPSNKLATSRYGDYKFL